MESSAPFLYFKPVRREEGNGTCWSVGENHLALAGVRHRNVYPYFDVDSRCSVCELRDAEYRYRVFSPPGYYENGTPLAHRRDPEASRFHEPRHKVVVAGIYPNDRESDYTEPGYERS